MWRGGEIRRGNIASGEIVEKKPPGPTSRGGGSGTSGGGGGTASKLEAEAAKAEGRATSVLRSVTELGKVGALDAALLYLQLHAAHFEALENVSKRVEIANDLLSHVEEFEKGARALRGTVNELQRVEAALPGEAWQQAEKPRLSLLTLANWNTSRRTPPAPATSSAKRLTRGSS
jgi:hypothetical protein